jgi:hypothetical protein
MRDELWVETKVMRGEDGRARVKKFGRTSEQAYMLGGRGWHVLRVLPGFLLRVAHRDVEEACQEQERRASNETVEAGAI